MTRTICMLFEIIFYLTIIVFILSSHLYIYINVILYDSVFLCTYTEYYYGSFKFYLESPTECRCDLHFTVFFY